jgi:hypothetical protein
MKKSARFLTIFLICGVSGAVYAGLPVQDLSSASLAVDYSGMWRGEQITAAKVPGHESVHLVNVRYAPAPWFLLSCGIGAANFSVDTFRQTQFKGSFSFSPAVGVNFYTPFFLKKTLRLTAGAKANYLYTRNRDKSYLYSGPFVTPGAGLIVSLGDYVDLEFGGRGDFIFGSMQKGGDNAQSFSNRERARAYCTATLHTPLEGAYLLVDFDGSPKMNLDWSNGPAESSLGISVGLILRQPRDRVVQQQKAKEATDYPGYKEMKKKINEMEEELK